MNTGKITIIEGHKGSGMDMFATMLTYKLLHREDFNNRMSTNITGTEYIYHLRMPIELKRHVERLAKEHKETFSEYINRTLKAVIRYKDEASKT